MRQTAILVLIFSSAAFAADPQLMNMVMPDAKILAGVNGNMVRISPFGQYIISKVAALNVEQRKMMAATGFDPLQDVTEVLAASNADRSQPSGLLLVEGKFDPEKIVAAITALNKVQVQTTAPGTIVLSVTDPKSSQTIAIAFIGSSLAVAGDLASVQAAIARNSGASSSAIDPALATQVAQLSANQDEWLVSSVPVGSLAPANAGAASGPLAQVLPVLQSIQSVSGGVNFGDNVVFTSQAVANNAANAAALGAVLKLAVTLASSMGNGKSADLAQLTRLLQTVQISTSDSTVSLSLSIPEMQVEALLNQVLKPPTPAVQPDARPRRRANGN